MRAPPSCFVALACLAVGSIGGCGVGAGGTIGAMGDATSDATSDVGVIADATHGEVATSDASSVDAPVAEAEIGSETSADARAVDASPLDGASLDAITDELGICGSLTGVTTPQCSPDGTELRVCTATGAKITDCARGCLRPGADGEGPACLGDAGTSGWACPGSYGKTRATDGDYYLTEFGCYTDSTGGVVTDPGDNCIPSCLDEAIAAGLCPFGSAGPDCEEKINWYTADGARFGCLRHLRITNLATGAEVIAIALDYGPSCSVEATVGTAALDASGPVNAHLFGGEEGISDRALVHVVEVDDTIPLGIVK
jgi:hypothetical protein